MTTNLTTRPDTVVLAVGEMQFASETARVDAYLGAVTVTDPPLHENHADEQMGHEHHG